VIQSHNIVLYKKQ